MAELFEITPAVHFVGFRGQEYHSAVRVWGKPDFIHPVWDRWAQQDIHPIEGNFRAENWPGFCGAVQSLAIYAGLTHLWTFERPSSVPTFGRSFIWLDRSFSAASRPPIPPKLVARGR